MHLKVLENQNQSKFNTSRKKEIIKIGAKTNKTKTKNIQRNNESKTFPLK